MHTFKVKTENYGEVIVLTNGDFSSDAIVKWKEKQKRKQAEIPGEVLVAVGSELSKEELKNRVIGFVENL